MSFSCSSIGKVEPLNLIVYSFVAQNKSGSICPDQRKYDFPRHIDTLSSFGYSKEGVESTERNLRHQQKSMQI